MRVPTGVKCDKCQVELTQDMSGNMHCKCGVRTRFGLEYFGIGSGNGNKL